MTDNEIIKALECCFGDNPSCISCKYDADTTTVDECMGKLMKDAIDLINRQKAEIERLKAEAQMTDGYADALEERAKAEAVKEFADKIKADAEWICDDSYIENDLIEYVDNLVKEMVGDPK